MKIANVKAEPKLFQETTAFSLTWDTPSELDGNEESDLKYQVSYCEINIPDTCKTTELSNERKVEITGLKKKFIYSYSITAFGKDNKAGPKIEQIYKTKASGKVLSQF